MKLYLAGICVGQTQQLLFDQKKKITLYLAGEHDVKNGLSRLTGGGGRTYAFWKVSTMRERISFFRNYITTAWTSLLIAARLLLYPATPAK